MLTTFPSRCAVAVVCGEHLISQVYPAAVPVEVFLDNVVELLNDDLKRRGVAPLDAGMAYELQRVNGVRLDASKSLDELGIEDGSTLVIVTAEPGESFEPQYESVSTALATTGRKLFLPVTGETALMTALVILGAGIVTALGLAVRTRLHIDSWVATVVLGLPGVVLALGAVATWKWWPERVHLSDGLAWSAIPLLAISCAMSAPGTLGCAHVFVVALAVAAMSYGLAAMTRRHLGIAATVVSLSGIVVVIAGGRMWRPIPPEQLGVCTLVGLLMLITAGPTIALRVARIRPPHFGSITGRDVFRRDDGLPADAVAPVTDDIDEEPHRDSSPRGAVIASAARQSNSVLTGICAAAAIALPTAVWFTLLPGQPKPAAAAILAALFIAIFVSRGRAFADRYQAVALVCGAAAAVCSGTARLVLNQPAESVGSLTLACLVLAMFAVAGLAVALIVPGARFTPLVRMFAEWVELAAIVAVLPLAAWIGGVFSWVRMR